GASGPAPVQVALCGSHPPGPRARRLARPLPAGGRSAAASRAARAVMELRTEHLALVPLSVTPEEVADRLGVIVPAGWPAPDLRDILPRYLSELAADSGLLGFGPWVLAADGEVVGDA